MTFWFIINMVTFICQFGCVALLWHLKSVKIENVKIETVKIKMSDILLTFLMYYAILSILVVVPNSKIIYFLGRYMIFFEKLCFLYIQPTLKYPWDMYVISFDNYFILSKVLIFYLWSLVIVKVTNDVKQCFLNVKSFFNSVT